MECVNIKTFFNKALNSKNIFLSKKEDSYVIQNEKDEVFILIDENGTLIPVNIHQKLYQELKNQNNPEIIYSTLIEFLNEKIEEDLKRKYNDLNNYLLIIVPFLDTNLHMMPAFVNYLMSIDLSIDQVNLLEKAVEEKLKDEKFKNKLLQKIRFFKEGVFDKPYLVSNRELIANYRDNIYIIKEMLKSQRFSKYIKRIFRDKLELLENF